MDKDQKDAIVAVAAITIAICTGLLAILLVGPEVLRMVSGTFSDGLGLKSAAVIAFFLTVVLFLVFAIAAGDGLLGEIQFMIAGFGGFFLVSWLMIAWIF